ncbi:MAG: THUMP domain-containing protein [Candidatus Aenigmatarchaeota archaeon]
MRQHDCILVRTGEQALKSKQVQKRWWAIFLNNIRAALQAAGVEFNFETNPSRVFVYTKETDKAIEALRHVFGVTSVSPVWTCHSSIEDINLLATEVATETLHLDNSKSFAIRAYRAGRHDFTSQAVAENAGAAVKRVTNARVDLAKPDHEIEIEVRSRKAYVFTSRVPGPGGLPVGTGGNVLAVIKSRDDALAAWLVAKRGVQLTILTDKNAAKHAEALKKWHYGKKMEILEKGKVPEIAKKREIHAIVTGGKVPKALEAYIIGENLLHLVPTEAMGAAELEKIAKAAEI